MAGILTQVIVTPSGGSSTVIIPPFGDAAIAGSGAYVFRPGAGTFTFAVQCRLADGTESTLPRSRRRVIVVQVCKK